MRLFGPSKTEETYKRDWEAWKKVVTDFIDSWQKEADVLRAVGLPVPQQVGDFSVTDFICRQHRKPVRYVERNKKIDSLCSEGDFRCEPIFEVKTPQFIIPNNHIGYFEDDHYRNGYFVILTDDPAVQTLNGQLDAFELLQLHPHIFVNRDPYYNYRFVMKQLRQYGGSVYGTDTFQFGPWARNAVSSLDRPLEKIPGFTNQELFRISKNRQLCVSLMQGIKNINLEKLTVASWMSEQWIEKPLDADTVTLKLLPPPDTKAQVSQQFFNNLRNASRPIAFEIVSENTIYFALTFAKQDAPLIREQLQLHFPAASCEVIENPTHSFFKAAVTVKKQGGFLKFLANFSIDPYNQLLSIFSENSAQSPARLQIILSPYPDAALNTVRAYITSQAEQVYDKGDKRRVTEIIREIEKKHPAWLVTINLFAASEQQLARLRQSFLRQYESPEQTFIVSPVSKVSQVTYQSVECSLLSSDEITALAHFPTHNLESDRLEIVSMKSKLPPDFYTKDGIQIGTSQARGQKKPVVIPHSTRDRHVYVVGKSGTGKSTLLYNCICQDIEAGSGVAVIDPHGDLVEDILNFIPESRIEDSIYFNAGDKLHPIGLNILNAQTEDEVGLLADDLIVTFKRISETWGERMDTILRYTFHTLLRVPDATLLDVALLLQSDRYRTKALSHISVPLITDFWENQFQSFPKDAAQPILNRMTKFALSPILSGIFGQADSALNFFDVIQNKKILLVNLSKGIIGEDSAQLLGSLIVSQLQLAIMRRAALPKESRDPYYLYVDEFQNFTTSAFEKILSEARKYKLCLTLAHQYISQLDEKTKNAILANVGTIIMFQSYPQDAALLRPELGQYEPSDVTNLNTQAHEALCKPATQSKDTFKFQTLPPIKGQQSNAQAIIAYTRENYSSGEPAESPSPEASQSKANATTVCTGCNSSLPPDARFCPKCGRPAGTDSSGPRLKRPAKALPKDFANTADKILHFVKQAEYLSTAQIIALCYGHIAESGRAPVASRDLKALVEGKRIKAQPFGKSKIYYTARACNPTTHNLAIRDLFVKILLSDFEIAEVNFFPALKGLTPDLTVKFLAEDGSFIQSFWEYDTGTEGIAELVSKVKRYASIRGENGGLSEGDGAVVFVFNTEERLQQVCRTIKEPFIFVAVLDQFQTLADSAFRPASGGEVQSLF